MLKVQTVDCQFHASLFCAYFMSNSVDIIILNTVNNGMSVDRIVTFQTIDLSISFVYKLLKLLC